jgi:hypothetical protein
MTQWVEACLSQNGDSIIEHFATLDIYLTDDDMIILIGTDSKIYE